MAAAAIIFFAFYGFDAIATAAEEAKNPSRDLAIGIVGSMVVCVIIYMAVAAAAIGAVASPGFANSAEPLALILRDIGQPWAAQDPRRCRRSIALADRHPRFLLRAEPDLLHVSPRRPVAARRWRACRAAATPVRITIFTAIVTSVFAGLIPLNDARRARQCRHAGGVHRGLRGDAGAAPARARRGAQVPHAAAVGHRADRHPRLRSICSISLPDLHPAWFLLWNAVIGLVLYFALRQRAARTSARSAGRA